MQLRSSYRKADGIKCLYFFEKTKYLKSVTWPYTLRRLEKEKPVHQKQKNKNNKEHEEIENKNDTENL